jgi:hypothetical protein
LILDDKYYLEEPEDEEWSYPHLFAYRALAQLQTEEAIEAIGFYERHGYMNQGSTGFYTDDDIWIPCQMFRKNLAVEAVRSSDDEVVRFVGTALLTAATIVVLKSLINSPEYS